MTHRTPLRAAAAAVFILSSLVPFPARAEETPKAADAATEKRLKELEQKLDVLTKEIESLRMGESPAASPPAAAPSPAATETTRAQVQTNREPVGAK